MNITYTQPYKHWIKKLRDHQARARIIRRTKRLAEGYFGDYKALGGGLYELREHYGAGYRIYYTQRGGEIIILLIGGDKSSQQQDIQKARILMEE